MSSFVSRALASLFKTDQECRALFIGLDAAGRTTALYQMKLGEVSACRTCDLLLGLSECCDAAVVWAFSGGHHHSNDWIQRRNCEL
mmetsp:Transcript_34386/g.76379  ORF Transcript_34386/g.76379 Transcript_34386/m.76379 type:complete len:86 (-) Transcript_34386:538-795(-)